MMLQSCRVGCAWIEDLDPPVRVHDLICGRPDGPLDYGLDIMSEHFQRFYLHAVE